MEVHLLESAVYHAEQGYAGRLDCLGTWQGDLYDVQIERALIAIALEDQAAQIFLLDAADLSHYWQQFLVRLRLWQQQQP